MTKKISNSSSNPGPLFDWIKRAQQLSSQSSTPPHGSLDVDADGHRLNFLVVHPITGKPCRAALVLFWDWRSSYPLGWEIMVEENIQCVASALRNAIIALGKIPKWIYLDNGKAFKAKIIKGGYTKFFKKARKILKAKRAGK